jgi:capsular polysaccharide transport system permease protein
MKPDSMKVRALKNKISSLTQQIYIERKRWSNKSDNSNNLNHRVADYEKLLAKKTVAERLYESALASLEAARLNAIQKQQYLEVIASPYKPSEAEKPYVISNMISIILGCLLFWIIGSLIVSAVKDHA